MTARLASPPSFHSATSCVGRTSYASHIQNNLQRYLSRSGYCQHKFRCCQGMRWCEVPGVRQQHARRARRAAAPVGKLGTDLAVLGPLAIAARAGHGRR